MNIDLAEKVITKLNDAGVSEFIVCAGARNAPFVKILAASKGATVHSFYDERAAGFFALGRVRESARPVAVVTTSGTAAAELLPAAIEAHYSGYPLVFVTADRPQTFRGSGSPQTIEQVGIYSYYTQKTLDVAKADDLPEKLSMNKSLHLNVCFGEPLLDQQIPELVLREKSVAAIERQSSFLNEDVDGYFAKVKRPLVILGALRENVRGRMLEFLSNLNAPVFAEAQSGLRECESLQPLILKAGEATLTADRVLADFDGVLRVGSVPTVRLWRDLDSVMAKLPVLSVSENEFSGLARETRTTATFANLFSVTTAVAAANSGFLVQDAKRFSQIEKLFLKFPLAEPSCFRRLSQIIPSEDLVFVGNSLPIREWDFAADYKVQHENVFANRGANGIDGLIATFMGIAKRDCQNWLVLGDLSALYDLNALSLAPKKTPVRIVVVNNGGGQIFEKMFNDKSFLNSHSLNFAKWAEMFGFAYHATDLTEQLEITAERAVIELKPDNAQTRDFWPLTTPRSVDDAFSGYTWVLG